MPAARSQSRRYSLVRVAVILAVAGYISLLGPSPSMSAPQGAVLLGAGVDATFGQIFVAVDKGFFAKQGLQAEYKIFDFGGATVQATAAGTIQVGNGGELSFLRPFSDGAKIAYVATSVITGRSGGVGAISGITKPQDLIGKKVAVIKGSTSELYQSLFFRKFGLDGKVDVLNIPAPDMIPALAKGEVQAMFVWEPWLTRLTETVKGSSVPWRYETDGVFKLYLGFVFNTDFIKRNPGVAEKTVRALIEATDWINAHQQEAAEIIAKPTRTPVPQILAQMKDLNYVMQLKREDLTHYRDQILPFALTRGLIKKSDPDALLSHFFYPALLKKAAPAQTDLP